MERSLILLKPDCMREGKAGEVISRFEQAGFQIIACKMIPLEDAVLKEHYAHITHLPFFGDIVDFMSSRPVLAMVLEGEGVIQAVRDLIGPTDPANADKGTIRGDLGSSSMQNVVHASDGQDSATIEIDRFFDPEDLFDLSDSSN